MHRSYSLVTIRAAKRLTPPPLHSDSSLCHVLLIVTLSRV
ncbi:BgTH12-02593 [Blumeria graminis f. sp. triticale]|uniref:Bgt-50268 n=2 Tax=Blumeria graminis TaxID=34373 RepID=A0A9X9QD81_BLUGR|nr:BgTH12-02593 [Blumeria graminis f. sp. triticale]VDB88747.1 Bgt-50268 [Blumeria graminis f. sp. tritici]